MFFVYITCYFCLAKFHRSLKPLHSKHSREPLMYRTFSTQKTLKIALFLLLISPLGGCADSAQSAMVFLDVSGQKVPPKEAPKKLPTDAPDSQKKSAPQFCQQGEESGPVLSGLGEGSQKVSPDMGVGGLWVRSAPALDAAPLGCLIRGDAVNVVVVEGDWAFVEFEGGEGWVWQTMLSKTERHSPTSFRWGYLQARLIAKNAQIPNHPSIPNHPAIPKC